MNGLRVILIAIQKHHGFDSPKEHSLTSLLFPPPIISLTFEKYPTSSFTPIVLLTVIKFYLTEPSPFPSIKTAMRLPILLSSSTNTILHIQTTRQAIHQRAHTLLASCNRFSRLEISTDMALVAAARASYNFKILKTSQQLLS